MPHKLETGVVERLFRLDTANLDDKQLLTTPHILQVLSLKPVEVNRQLYRVLLSDGRHFIQAMLAAKLNHLVANDSITRDTVIITEKISCHYIQSNRLFVLLSLRVIDQVSKKIGDPQIFKDKDPNPALTASTRVVQINEDQTVPHVLETGIVERLYKAEPDDEQLLATPHTLQVPSLKLVKANEQLYRVLLSDGRLFIQAMIASQLNHLVANDSITRNAVIMTEEMSCHYVQGKRLLVLLSLRVIGQVSKKIGDPRGLKNEDSNSASTVSTLEITAPPIVQYIAEWAHTHARIIDCTYKQKGGWEGWCQVELAEFLPPHYASSVVFREENVYTIDSQADLQLCHPDGTFDIVEFKCESLHQDKSGDRRNMTEFSKAYVSDLNKIRNQDLSDDWKPATVWAIGITCQEDVSKETLWESPGFPLSTGYFPVTNTNIVIWYASVDRRKV